MIIGDAATQLRPSYDPVSHYFGAVIEARANIVRYLALLTANTHEIVTRKHGTAFANPN